MSSSSITSAAAIEHCPASRQHICPRCFHMEIRTLLLSAPSFWHSLMRCTSVARGVPKIRLMNYLLAGSKRQVCAYRGHHDGYSGTPGKQVTISSHDEIRIALIISEVFSKNWRKTDPCSSISPVSLSAQLTHIRGSRHRRDVPQHVPQQAGLRNEGDNVPETFICFLVLSLHRALCFGHSQPARPTTIAVLFITQVVSIASTAEFLRWLRPEPLRRAVFQATALGGVQARRQVKRVDRGHHR